MKIKKGDRVIVLSGKHRGEQSEVLTVLPSRNAVILDSLNIAKRATRQTRAVMQAGIIDKFMPIDASAVAIWCSKHKGPARVGYRIEGDTKIRVCKQCGEKL
jgi:large subunit ribosomal protein L24